MGQDWKTLSLVIVAAAFAGWLTMRALGSDPGPRIANPPKPVAATPASIATAAAVTVAPAAPPMPAAPTPAADVPVAAGEVDESGAIVHELEALALALVKDQRIEDRVMPRVNDILEIPGLTTYRRAPDFWQSALAPSEGNNP